MSSQFYFLRSGPLRCGLQRHVNDARAWERESNVLHRYRWRINGVPIVLLLRLCPSTTMRRTGSRRAGNTSKNDCASDSDWYDSKRNISRRHCCVSSIRDLRVSLEGSANPLKTPGSLRKRTGTIAWQNDNGQERGKTLEKDWRGMETLGGSLSGWMCFWRLSVSRDANIEVSQPWSNVSFAVIDCTRKWQQFHLNV